MKLARIVGLCLALLSGACERAATAPMESSSALQAGTPLPGFARHDARLTVAHAGVRRLEFEPESGPTIAFDERIVTDGTGRYALEPVGALVSSTLDWRGFELIHHLREGFFYRYRDFAVRAPRAFARNWRVIDLARTELVAGRPCARYRVERLNGAAWAFELSVDPLTDLVLASEEFDASGRKVASMTYRSIDLAPDLAAQAWHESANEETALDPARDLGEQIEARALVPRLVPSGYAPLEAAVVGDGNHSWLKLTYSDGVQPLFFLHQIHESSSGKAAKLDGQRLDAPRSPSSVIVCQVGAATAIQGTVDGVEVIVVGKVAQAELLDMIESALP